MIADSFFQQGAGHEVCEDYAVHGDDYAIVSDGCSNGGGPSLHTDWGSRLLCKAAERYRKALLTPVGFNGCPDAVRRVFLRDVLTDARYVLKSLPDMAPECLTATLGIVQANRDTASTDTLLVGDGVVGARRRDGSWLIRVYEPASGACFYPKYLSCEGETETYFQKFGRLYKLTQYVMRFGKLEEMDVVEEPFPLDPDKPYFSMNFPMCEYDIVFVGTDGLKSFYQKINTGTSKHTEPVAVPNVLEVLFDGLQRRPGLLRLHRNWAFKQARKGTFVQRDWHSADDCSVGIVHC